MRILLTLLVFMLSFHLGAQSWKAGYDKFFEQVQAQDYFNALTTGEETLRLLEEQNKTTDTLYADIAYYMGYIHFSNQQYDKALAYGIRDVEVRRKLKGVNEPQYYTSLYMLVAYYGHLEKYDQAIPLMKEIAAYAQKQYGEKDKNAIQMNYQLANLYQNGGYVYKAEEVHEQNYETVQKNYTPADSIYQATVNAIYMFYYTTGNFRKAEPFYTGALVQLEQQYGGKENANYLSQLMGLIQFYVNGNMLPEAVETYTGYLVLLAKVLGGKENADYRAALENYLEVCMLAAAFDEADKAYQEYLPLIEKEKGTKKDTAYLIALNTVGEFYIHAGKYEKAEKTFLEYQKLVESVFGKNSADHATALNNLAVAYEKLGKNADAEKLYLETLKIKEKVFKKESNYYALTFINLGVLYDNMGRYKEAEKVLEQAVQIYEKISGGKTDNYATALNSIASVYSSNGKTKQAVVYMEKALDIYKNADGEESQGYIMSLGNLATIHVELGDYAKAEAEYEKAVLLSEKVLGKDHADLGTTVYNLANLKTTLGKYDEAERLLLRSLAIQQKAVGEKHARYASALQSLASLYATIGKYDLAEKTYKKCEVLFRKVYGERHPEFATLLSNMAWFYTEKAEYREAADYINRAITIHLDNFGLEHPNTIPLLGNKANISLATGDPKTAEELLLATVKIAEKAYGTQHPNYASSLNNLATLYRSLGNYDQAKMYYEKALDLRKKIYGEQHQEYAVSLNNLGSLYLSIASDTKDPKELEKNAALAILQFKQAARIDSVALGKDHPDLANHLNNLAEAYRLVNEPALAEKNYLRAIEIEKKNFGEDHAGLAVTYHNLALLYAGKNDPVHAEEYALRSVKIFEKNFGPASHAAVNVTSSLAYIYEMQQKDVKALEQYAIAGKINQEILQNNFSFLSENEKEKFLASSGMYKDMFNTFALKYGKKDPVVHGLVYDQAIRDKGILFRSSAGMRERALASGDTALVSKYERWNNLKKQLAEEYAAPTEKRNKGLAELESQANTLEKELVTATGTKTESNRSWQDIRKQLLPGQAAIEFIDFMENDEKKQNIYCALVLKPGVQQPAFIRLFAAPELEKLIGKFGANNYDYITRIYGKRTVPAEQVYQLVWKALEKELEGAKEIYYSPSGLLNKISFAALKDDKNIYLSDKYVLHAVTGTAVIVDRKEEKVDPASALVAVFGGVKYDTEKTKTEVWKYLPGTLAEAEKINGLLASAKVKTQMYTGTNASETNVKGQEGTSSPAVLHVATHGFFYADPGEIQGEIKTETAQVDFRGGSRGVRTFVENPNPLMRSGIALAGANDVWNEENVSGEDGVLTAYEVSLLNLQNTKLTVLSACETGLGDIKGSEGVYGLQRAFRMAGSQFVIMSLWQVPDKETEEFMVGFYTALLKNKSIRKAFTETQTAMRKKYDPYFWAAFVLME